MSTQAAVDRRRLQGRRGIVIATIAIGVFAIAAIVVVTAGGGSSTTAGSPSTSVATTEIKRQDLVESDEEDGTLGYSDSRDVVNHLTGYITWLPGEGSVVRPNHTLYKVDRSPVILLSGDVPAYRTLDSSASGADVRQLEQNLEAFGYASGLGMTVDGDWTSATTTAVEHWQDAHGLSQTGSIEFGRIVFQPGARRVSSVNATLGSSSSGSGGTGSGAGAATGSTGASTSTSDDSTASTASASSSTASAQVQTAVYRTSASSPATTQVADSETGTTTPAPTTTTPSTGTTGPTGPTGDDKSKTGKDKPKTKRKKSKTGKGQPKTNSGGSTGTSGAAGTATGAAGGASGSSSGSSSSSVPTNTIMTTTSNRKTVTVDLDTTKSSLAKLGAQVTVTLPSGNTVHGRIVSIGKVATTSGSGSGSGSSSSGSSSSGSSSSSNTATIKLTIKLFSKGTALDQAPVTVRFEQSRAKGVLAIPVTALLARPGGKFAVEVVDGSKHRLVSVEPGVYTSGYVQITGAGVKAGMRVTNAAVQ